MAADLATHEFLTVPELAELLRVKERKVYDLAAAGEVPCTRVTGKLLFPERAVRAWLAAGSGAAPAPARPAICLGSSDPLLEWALSQSRSGIATLFDGSLDGLERFEAGGGIAAGLHIADVESGHWNLPALRERGLRDAVLLSWARRERGLVVRDPAIRGPGDLAGRRFAPRQTASGTHRLTTATLGGAGLSVADLHMTPPARTEAAAVAAVADGTAEATLGLAALAALHDLIFVPLMTERFDLLVARPHWFEEPLQTLAAFCRSDFFADRARSMPGYDVADCLTVRWNAPTQ